ncbi:MAG: AAA family ATPase [Deltaproteobacteria bacterium]|jgi:hypothetical protein|nr:AAA family ATPase [Deltaproteobacteria bacterium]
MRSQPKVLPPSGSTFREIIEGGFLYADKTKYIYWLVKRYKSCFLSRPRRFGKTLLLDTIRELFQGDRELFKGLFIENKSDYAFEKHPVLRFSMGYAKLLAKKDLEDRIEYDLRFAAKNERVKLSAKTYGEMLGELLYGISVKYRASAVILIDEYDSPVARHISNPELASDFRDVLHEFYSALKQNFMYIRFSILTGTTRLAFTASDSGPNSFKDISLKPEFAGICGFTVPEFNKIFKNRFSKALKGLKKIGDIGQDAERETLKAKILEWYGGYNWLGKDQVLNPYSIINFFDDERLCAYWPSSGHPSRLSALMRERPLDFIRPKLDSYFVDDVRSIDINSLEAVPVLFHSGYLTIDHRIRKNKQTIDGKTVDDETITFRFPNREVSLYFTSFCVEQIFCLQIGVIRDLVMKLPGALLREDSEVIADALHNLLAGPMSHMDESPENRYRSMLHVALLAAGLEVIGETHGKSRSDSLVLLADKVRVVIGLKYCKAVGTTDKERLAEELASGLDEAEVQILDNDSIAPDRTAGCKVICLALAFRGKDEVAARFFDPEKIHEPRES